MVNMLVGWDDFSWSLICKQEVKNKKEGLHLCVQYIVESSKTFRSQVSAWKVVWVDFLRSADQYSLLYGLFNQCARLNVAFKLVTFMNTLGEMVIWGSLGFRLMSQLMMGWRWAPDRYGPSSHGVTVVTAGDGAAAATPPADCCCHWSVGARPSALLHRWWAFLVGLSIKKLTEEHPSIRLNVPLSELLPGFCPRWFFNPVTFVFWFAEYPQQLIIWIRYMDKPIQEDGWWVKNIDICILANQIMQGERLRWMALVVEMGLKMEPEKRSLGFSTTNFCVCVSHPNECGCFSSRA